MTIAEFLKDRPDMQKRVKKSGFWQQTPEALDG